MHSSTPKSDMDQLVQLYDPGQRLNAFVHPNVQRVPFRDFKDLYCSVAYPNGIDTTSETLGASVSAPLPSSPATLHGAVDSQPAVVDQNIRNRTSVGDVEDEHAEGEDSLLNIAEGEELAKYITEEQKEAATRILKSFRRYRRRNAAFLASQSKPVFRHFAVCMAMVKGDLGQCLSRRYTKIYLGPLPHILAFIDVVHDRSFKEREEAKRQIKVAAHERLEELQDTVMNCR